MQERHSRAVVAMRALIAIGALVGALAAAAPASAIDLDRDDDGLRNRFERVWSHTSPVDADSDDDGVSDARENPDHDGLRNRFEQVSHTDPRDKDSDDDGLIDARDDEDCDGLDNADEQKAGTSPVRDDSDDDGIDDADEDSDDEASRTAPRIARARTPATPTATMMASTTARTTTPTTTARTTTRTTTRSTTTRPARSTTDGWRADRPAPNEDPSPPGGVLRHPRRQRPKAPSSVRTGSSCTVRFPARCVRPRRRPGDTHGHPPSPIASSPVGAPCAADASDTTVGARGLGRPATDSSQRRDSPGPWPNGPPRQAVRQA